ncbi:MAG: hypothetical protein AMS15_00130 [Planctomycetes bacterium DG_23]|nr:MAG: hypothetical protein AMS15_00130 [Planctomycetes bacterium DG_23]
MRALTLTWEFPPRITGGLGMACYGMVKALLRLGVEVDLVIPADEEVYFALRREQDADSLPLVFADPTQQKRLGKKVTAKEMVSERIEFFDVYYTPAKKWLVEELVEYAPMDSSLEPLLSYLTDDHPLFRAVRAYTALAINIAKRLDFDIIHTHDWMTYIPGILIKGISGKPLVAHIHATEFDRAGGPGDRRIHDVEYIGMQSADRVLSVSDYTAKIILQRYKVAPEKIRIVHNAFTLQKAEKTKERMFREPLVVFLGRITLQKGPDYFLEVARRVLQEERNVRFVMGGRGDMEKKILYEAASLGQGTKFLFAGFLAREEVEQVLSAADIFVMPSVSEPFGITPLEAMSYGAVTIISKRSGVAEVVKHAYKVDYWDIEEMSSIILDLIRNPEKLREASRRSMEEVARLQWEEAAKKISNIYTELQEGR